MGLIRFACLFDYSRFYDDVSILLPKLDDGDYHEVYEWAQKSVQDVEPEEWILHNLGTSLEPSCFETDSGIAINDPNNVGYCLLVILSSYLDSYCSDLDENWDILQRILRIIGWNSADSELLIKGMPLEKLLKPTIENVEGCRRHTDPYWKWVIPDYAYTDGWLPKCEIQRLRTKLLESENLVRQFDFVHYPNINVQNPVVIQDYRKRLQAIFTNSLAVLSAAKEKNMGVFIVIA